MKRILLLFLAGLTCMSFVSCGRLREENAVMSCYNAAKEKMDAGDYAAAAEIIDEAASRYGDGALLDSLRRQTKPATESRTEEATAEGRTESITTAPKATAETDNEEIDALLAFDDYLLDDDEEYSLLTEDYGLRYDDDLWQTETTATQTKRVQETTTRAPETTTRAQETTTRAQVTTTRAQETTTRAQVPTTRAQETTAGAQTPTRGNAADSAQKQTSAAAKPAAVVPATTAPASDRTPQTQPSTTPVFTVAEKSAREQALDLAKESKKQTAIARSRMIDQIKAKGFSEADAVYAADHCGADWNVQAFKAAKQYAAGADDAGYGCSRDELKTALRSAGFTESEASYAADRVGVNRNAQAANPAAAPASGENANAYDALKEQLQAYMTS